MPSATPLYSLPPAVFPPLRKSADQTSMPCTTSANGANRWLSSALLSVSVHDTLTKLRESASATCKEIQGKHPLRLLCRTGSSGMVVSILASKLTAGSPLIPHCACGQGRIERRGSEEAEMTERGAGQRKWLKQREEHQEGAPDTEESVAVKEIGVE
eukprot:1844374-Rhodomonas_salina.1